MPARLLANRLLETINTAMILFLYFIVIASRNANSLASVVPRLSVLVDRDEHVYRDYQNVTRAVDVIQKQWSEGFTELSDEITKLRAGLAHAEALVSERDATIREQRAELDRIHGFWPWKCFEYLLTRF
jgi:hypothetical protein